MFSTVPWQPRDTGSVKTEGHTFTFQCRNTFGSGPTSVSLVSFIWVLFIVMLLLTEKKKLLPSFQNVTAHKPFPFYYCDYLCLK